MMSVRALLVGGSSLLLACAGLGLCAEPVPVTPGGAKVASAEVYGALPAARLARLSPNGRYLALIAPVGGRDALVVRDLDGLEKPVVIPTGSYEPDWFVWKSDRRLVLSLRFHSLRNPLRPTVDTRLIALDADGGNLVELVKPSQFSTYVPQIQDKVVSLLPADKDHILIELPALERNPNQSGLTGSVVQVGSLESRVKYPEVVSVDINTGQLRTVLRQRAWVVSWRADADGVVRLGRTLRDKTLGIEVRESPDGAWSSIQSFEINKGRVFVPVGFLENDSRRLYVISNHQGGPGALYEFDVPTATFVRTVAANPRGNVEAIEQEGRLLGYRLAAYGSPVYLDSRFAREARVINGALPDSRNDIIDRSTDGKRILLRVARDNEPPDFWLLDRSGGKAELSPLVSSYPGLEAGQIAATRAVSYRARDGLLIPALLTLPPGSAPAAAQRSARPFVILPHGGPTSHDVPGFNYLVQFLASRGYGVLQPQFRGSTGYGAAFESAGLQQWGLAMQDDLTDGTRWLIEQKLADPARIAIVGASYGGYAALMGLVKEPGLYRCAAAIAPVTDLNLLLDSDFHFLWSDLNMPRIGMDSALLDRTSPARNAERIQAPLLLVHGRKDDTVPVAQTERMENAMRRAGKTFDMLYLQEADHYLSRGDDRITTLQALERFLAKNLNAP